MTITLVRQHGTTPASPRSSVFAAAATTTVIAIRIGDTNDLDQAYLLRRLQHAHEHVTTWDDSDPRLPLAVDTDAPQYKRDYRWEVAYFRGQPSLDSTRPIADAKGDGRVRRGWVFGDIPMTRANGLWLSLKKRRRSIMVMYPASGSSHPPTRCSTRSMRPLRVLGIRQLYRDASDQPGGRESGTRRLLQIYRARA